jgi:AbrB family looped-hinge helix DNA binding protein
LGESKEPKFYGAVTVSERGQVAIPVDARRDLKIEEGEKLLVFGAGEGTLFFARAVDLKRRMGKMLSVYRSALQSDEVEERRPEKS